MKDVFNLHGHTKYCDGECELEDYALKAIELGYKVLGFSSHAPIGLDSYWHMSSTDYELYKRQAKALKEKYSHEIDILLGLETDYIKGVISPSTHSKDLDYTVGSVHFVRGDNNKLVQIDESKQTLEKALEENFPGGIKQVATLYYEALGEMLEIDAPEILGHFDLIKKFNELKGYFDETESWYRELVEETLKKVKASGSLLEVNTRGYYKNLTSDVYPSKWILEKCVSMDIPITLNADAHHPDELSKGKEQAHQIMKSAGVKEIFYLNGSLKRVRVEV